MSPSPILLALMAAAGCTAAAQVPPGPSLDSKGLPLRLETVPPRLPEGVPEAQEAAAALAAGSSTALIQFLARHPEDANAARVRAALAARGAPDGAATLAAAGGEAEIVADFDAARRAGTDAAWDAFIARYKGHPLAAEAARWR